MPAPFLGSLFHERPPQYGLRGDPGLWDALETRFAATPMPKSFAALWQLLEEGYQDAVGQSLCNPNSIQIARFDRGGMSQGAVSPQVWAERLFPMISNRFAAHCQRQVLHPTDLKR